MISTIYLVRHGRTALNAEGRFRGRQDPPLDERGRMEAEVAAERLASCGIEVVYSSPLLRSVQTAEPIARRSGVRVELLEALIDLDYGRWNGLTEEEAAHLDPDAFARFRRFPQDAVTPGGETVPQVERRVTAALLGMGERHPGAAVAAVSHELPIRLVTARLSGMGGAELWDLELPTGSITALVSIDGTLSLAASAGRV